jgi:uncharacterized protein YifN (PemK superfamily)
VPKFHIVEVDFGFYSDVFSIDGSMKRNQKYTEALLPGELHKRRPCILLAVQNRQVQVIPLSTKTTIGHDPKNVPLSKASFSKLASRYSEAQSYALLGMIQTVSVNRIFPPRNKNGKVEHKYQLYSIAAPDKNALKSALAQQYTHGIVYQNELLNRNLEKLSQEKMKILSSNNKLKDELKEIGATVDELRNFILRFGKDLGAGDTFEKIIHYYDHK